MKALWNKYPKRIKHILAVGGAFGFCLSLALALWNDVRPLSELAVWVLVGTPVLGIVAILLANALVMACVTPVDRARGSRSRTRNEGIAVNPSTGLMMTGGGVDSGGNQLGGHWSSSSGSIDCGTSSGSGFGSNGFGL